MFGHQDEPAQPTNTDQPAVAPGTEGIAGPTPGFVGNPIVPPANPTPVSDTNYLLDAQAADGQTGAPEVSSDTPAAQPSDNFSASTPDSAAPATTPSDAPVGGSDALLNLKQQALQQLSPLVGQLEQSPEEKFRTTMMMIQASDNQALLQTAYEAANQILDEKARAQALLDVINEINYFAQQGK